MPGRNLCLAREEPELWFHDIFRKDGTPYSKDEVTFIKKLCAEGAK
jgi:hypothetical protein